MTLVASLRQLLNGNRHQFCKLSGNICAGMKKFILATFCFLLITSFALKSNAQIKDSSIVKVAVFVPLFINDAFNGDTYKLGKLSMPKYILPGLEFYNGVMMAIDSLRQEGIVAEISIYDTKNVAEFARAVSSSGLNNVGIIIAAITNTTELTLLANAAKQKKIPLISATYPNSGSVNSNPYFVLLNSSLPAHVEGIYKYLQNNHKQDNIILLKRSGAVENYVKNVLNDLNKNSTTGQLKMKWVDLVDTFSNYQLTRYIDTLNRNIIVVASPDENYGIKIANAVSSVSNAQTTLIGMPTWDGISQFNRSSDVENVQIVYSTPFNYTRKEALGLHVAKEYRSKFSSRPSDMVFRGYETVFHFTKLLNKHHKEIIGHLSDTDFTLFNNFDIQPVKLKKDNIGPDYYENKKLYFIKKQQGDILKVSSY